jgi:hypothetical protein
MASNRYALLEVDNEPRSAEASAEASYATATDRFKEKRLGDVKIGWASFINLLLTFIVSGETLAKSDKVIDKLAAPILGDIFEQVFGFYTSITNCSERFRKVFKPFFLKPEKFVKIYNAYNPETANEQSNFTLSEADSTTIAFALQQRLHTIMSQIFGSYDYKSRTFYYENDPSQWTAQKLALKVGGISPELIDEADEFLSFVNTILGIDGGIKLHQFIRNAYKEASAEKQMAQASLPKFVPKTITKQVKNETGEVETKTKIIFRFVRPNKKETSSDGFTRLVHSE